MHLHYRNANDAFRGLVKGFDTGAVATGHGLHEQRHTLPLERVPSRAGDVVRINEPMTITYSHPWERVLFNQARDCNPFFHLFESLWMLAGNHDVASLMRYNGKIEEVASDDGLLFNGAYGYRWRKSAPVVENGGFIHVDQLEELEAHLRNYPDTRRAVLQMWNVRNDLMRVDDRHDNYSKDVCCNTAAYFTILDNKLDITVTNRSNDLVWGMLGSNYVCFSMLQEWLARRLRVGVGRYHQFTNNLHVYTEVFDPKAWLADDTTNLYTQSFFDSTRIEQPLFDLKEVQDFVACHGLDDGRVWTGFLGKTMEPMLRAYDAHKNRQYLLAQQWAKKVVDADWRFVTSKWISKRQELYERRTRGKDSKEESQQATSNGTTIEGTQAADQQGRGPQAIDGGASVGDQATATVTKAKGPSDGES